MSTNYYAPIWVNCIIFNNFLDTNFARNYLEESQNANDRRMDEPSVIEYETQRLRPKSDLK